jgi:hypothetical protein
MMTALAVALLIVGLLNLFVKDLVWQLTGSGSVIEGLPAERNAQWDLWMNVAGWAALGLAFVFWYFG